MEDDTFTVHEKYSEPWKVTCADTGEDTMTGGRLKRISKYLKNENSFCMTYGDGVSDVNISNLIKFHDSHGLKATVTAATPPSRFGALILEDNFVKSFEEKPSEDQGKVNSGFFVLSADVLDLIKGDKTIWEREPLEKLVEMRQLAAYVHDGFWQPMDTLRDKTYLQSLWDLKEAPWKVW